MKRMGILGLVLLLSLFVHLQPLMAQDAIEATVRVEDSAICQQVVDRVPMGKGDVFPPDVPELYCFTRIVGAEVDTEVTHNWYFKGNLMSSVVLPVGSASWRTWSKKEMAPELMGEWMVEILSKEGVPLESIIFFLQ